MPADQVLDIPADQFGLLILNDLLRTREWNEYNYLLSAQRTYQGEAVALTVFSFIVASVGCSRHSPFAQMPPMPSSKPSPTTASELPT